MGFKRPGPANGESLDAPIKDGTLARVVASPPVSAGRAAQTPKRTSGRRSLVDQARAMAQNVAKNRKWISETYAASTLGARCQRWLDVNAKKTSQSDIERGLLDVLQDATDTERRHLSKHLSGDAFDVQPVTERSSARCASSSSRVDVSSTWKAASCAGMRSSNRAIATVMLVFGAACTMPRALAAVPAVRCVARADFPNAGAANAAGELRRAVERGALYRAMAASSPPVSCQVEQADARTVLAWRFRDGATLRVEREAEIEYTNQEARVGSLFSGNGKKILERTERAVFGRSGCGIDWRRPAPATAQESVFSGDVCNCEARVGRDGRGRVQTLAFRTAC